MEHRSRPGHESGGVEDMPGRHVRAMRRVDGLMLRVDMIAMVLSALAIVAITIIVCAEVILRGVFGISTLISAEFAGYLLAANVYLGLAWTFRDGGFIRVEILPRILRGRAEAALEFVLALVACLIFCIYTWHLISFVAQTYRAGTLSVFITRTPLWIPQLVMPIGSALMAWALLVTTLRAAYDIVVPKSGQTKSDLDSPAEAGIL